jgi:hypothetical protein
MTNERRDLLEVHEVADEDKEVNLMRRSMLTKLSLLGVAFYAAPTLLTLTDVQARSRSRSGRRRNRRRNRNRNRSRSRSRSRS